MRPAKNQDGGTLGYCTSCGLVKYVSSYEWLVFAGTVHAIKRCRCTRATPYIHRPVPAEYFEQGGKIYTGPTHVPAEKRRTK